MQTAQAEVSLGDLEDDGSRSTTVTERGQVRADEQEGLQAAAQTDEERGGTAR